MKEISYSRILDDESSFQLVRTNPKLTGNVKFTIDSEDKLFLNSIDANEELSKDQYKKVSVDLTKSIPANLYKFFNGGQTPREIVFDLNESFDPVRTSTDFKDQYDFSNYFSGAKYLASRKYSERLSYFAPLFLNQDIPDYFIILKIKDPINKKINLLEQEYPYNRENYIIETFKNSKVIKTFNLKEETKIGRYLRDYLRSNSFPSSPLTVSYQEGSLTYWNGIMYDSGTMGSRGENLYEFYQQSYPIKFFEEFLTLGYERNGIIFPNIINLEFAFNDTDESDLYDFDRYIGFYVNAIELSKLDIDLDRMYEERGTWENTPRLRKKIFEWEDIQLNQSNPNGVLIPLKNSEVLFSDFEDIFKDKDNLYFNYLLDKNNSIFIPKLDSPWSIDYSETNQELNSAKLRIGNSKIDFGKMFGPGSVFIQDSAFYTENRGFSNQYIKVDSFNHLDEIKIYHPMGSRSDYNGRHELIRAAFSYSEVPDPGSFYVYNDIDNITGEDIFYFNPTGLKNEKAKAIAGCINGMRNAPLKAYAFEEYVFIKLNTPGEFDNLYRIEFNSPTSVYSGIAIGDLTGSQLIGTLISFNGGSREEGNRLIIDSDHLLKIEDNLNNILVKTKNGWSKIRKISKYQDVITEKNGLTELSRASAISDYFGKIVLTLDLNESPDVEYGNCLIYRKYQPSFGLISFFPIKDFDFDFYSSEYLNFPIIDLYRDYFVPPGLKLLDHNYTYEVFGDGVIEINGTQYSTGSQITLAPSSEKYQYSQVSGDAILSFSSDISSLGSRLDISINDLDKELIDFPGYFLLKDPDLVVPEQQGRFFELRNKYLNGLSTTEYDFYKENYSKEFALKSKIIPYITKWAFPDGKDSRNNPYRLNSELVFGFNNFSPDHEDRTQNPDNFTHEWFYIESNFNYLETPETVSINDTYFENPFDLNEALTDPNYFINYFTYTPTFNGEEVSRTQTRYSPIKKDFLDQYSCFFKGFKINFKEYIDSNNLDSSGKPIPNPDSTRFEDYKFTTLLKLSKEDINEDGLPPISYKFIEHTDFKFIILLIELNIGDISNIDDWWKEVQSGAPIQNPVDRTNFLDVDPRLTSNYVFDSINGDYRISFKQIDGIDISDITNIMLYSMKNKKFNVGLNNFSNVKLSQKVNLSNSGAFTSGGNEIEGLPNLNFSNYVSRFSDEIHLPNESNFLICRNKALIRDEFLDFAPGLVPQLSNKLVSSTNKTINLSTNSDIYLIDELATPLLSIPTGIPANYFRTNYVFKIMAGGKLYFESLFQKLSFGEFKGFVNSLNPVVEYLSYSWNGTLNQSTQVKWYSEIPDYSSIEKKTALLAKTDQQRPSNFSFNSTIGYSYETTKLDNSYEINRYDGGYSPLFKELSAFKSRQIFTANDISDLESGNTRFNLNVSNFLKIENFNHIKIANEKILDLESNEQFDPLYELIGEIAVGQGDYDLLLSNWDFGFHYKYPDKVNKIPVPGTLRIEEDYSFVSKLINLREEIELENFTSQQVQSLASQNINDIELVYVDSATHIEGIINVANVIKSFLLSDGISSKFNDFLENQVNYIGNNNTIEEYVKKYISLNILKLYTINEVEIFSKEVRDGSTVEGSPNPITFSFLNDTQRNSMGYKLNRNLQINKIDNFVLSFRFNKSLNSGLSISPKIKINFI